MPESVNPLIALDCVITAEQAGQRLDQVLAAHWSDYSRSRLTQWIRGGEITVDGETVKPSSAVQLGQQVCLRAEPQAHRPDQQAQAMTLTVLVDDPDLFVIDKPAGLVVHPGAGNPDQTLVNGLLHLDPGLAQLPRAGLIHRLDKDTSGCLVVARTDRAHRVLVEMMKDRLISRTYLALVWGEVIAGGTIEEPIGRHPSDRRRQVVRPDGREAITHYRVEQRFAKATLLRVQLETGRTHQIRVHLAHQRLPIIGDPVYGRRGAPGGLAPSQRECWQQFPRQALHAWRLELPHPLDASRQIEAQSPIPADFAALLEVLDAQ